MHGLSVKVTACSDVKIIFFGKAKILRYHRWGVMGIVALQTVQTIIF